MKNFTLLVLLMFSTYLFAGTPVYRLPSTVTSADYLAGTIILKPKPAFRNYFGPKQVNISSLKDLFNKIGVDGYSQKFPRALPGSLPYTDQRVDISDIIEIHYSSASPIEKTIQILLNTGIFAYAEPHFIQKPLYTPNDPNIGNQYYLTNIKAFQGWDISKGDTNTVIGITDTGFDLDHPELINAYKHNYADQINGIDDDGDGYIDNFTGYDIGEGDNDPSVNPSFPASLKPSHGVSVSGCAAGTADNNLELAGVSFKCRILPVKVTGAGGYITAGYEGIVYAADHGAKIINCSWGGADGGSQFGQDVINYALSKGALVVAAAGNSNNEVPLYPASYDHVLSVAGTDPTDVKWVASSYGIHVDVSAPGQSIYTTDYDNGYKYDSGTSFASPIAAGCAAIIRSYYPSYSPLQVAEQLRVTSDDIDGISGNGAYTDRMGKGRVNLFNALTQSSPSIRVLSYTITDNNDSIFTDGDTLRISLDFINYLAAASSASVTLSSPSSFVNILNPTFNIGNLASLGTTNNSSAPFKVVVLPGAGNNYNIEFKLSYSATSYTDFEYLNTKINPDYFNMNLNKIGTTITSNGRLGYNGFNIDGIGFTYKNGYSLTYEMGFMIGVDTNKVSDCVRGDNSTPDNDFFNIQSVRKVLPPAIGDIEFTDSYNDFNAATPLFLTIEQKSFEWKNSPDDKFAVIDYFLTNNSASTYNNIYAGIFSDWDIQNTVINQTGADTLLRTGYAFSLQNPTFYTGVKLINQNIPFHCYSLDNTVGGNGGIDISDGFSSSEKYRSMSGQRYKAGVPSGNDIAQVVAAGPFKMLPGDTVRVRFALIGADSLNDLKKTAVEVDKKFNGTNSIVHDKQEHVRLAPNPSYPGSTGFFSGNLKGSISMEILDITGRTCLQKNLELTGYNQYISFESGHLHPGVYFFRLSNGEAIQIQRLVIKN